jgi:hypothetical protein
MFNWAVVGRLDAVSGKLCGPDGEVLIASFLEACLDNGLSMRREPDCRS